MKIGFQGIEGAHSEAALFHHYGDDAQAQGFQTFEEVFEAISSGDVDAGVIPFENSITGSLVQNYDLMLANDVSIVGEVVLDINHHLLAKPGASLESIKKVYSHPQALDQCKSFVRKHKLESVPVYDTAGGAKIVKDSAKDDEAAIASRFCGKIYGLEPVAEYIADTKVNQTKFFVIVKNENVSPNPSGNKTSIAFKTKHYPGALINCLQRFQKNNVNMSKLESRPVPENPFEYVFYVDVEGGIEEENVALSLEEVEAAAEYVKVLGSYPKAEKSKE